MRRFIQSLQELILKQSGIATPSRKLLFVLVFSNIVLLAVYFVSVAPPLIALSVLFEWNLSNQSIYDTYVFAFRPTCYAVASCYCLWHYRASFSLIGTCAANTVHRYRKALAIAIACVLLFPRLDHLDALFRWIQETQAGLNGVQPGIANIIDTLPHGDWRRIELSLSPLQLIVYTFFICSIGPVYEEIVYSGLLCNYLTKKTGLICGLLLTPVFFAASHTYWYDLSTDLLYIWYAGQVYVLLRALTGSVWFGMAVHAVHNAILYAGVWALKLSFD